MRLHLTRLVAVSLATVSLLLPSTTASAASPGYALTQTASHYVIRWNPCMPIHYKVNVTHAPKGALADVKAAVAALHKASGLVLVYDGQTGAIPQQSFDHNLKPGHFPPLVIAWARPGTGAGASNLLPPAGAAGVGGIAWYEWFSRNGQYLFPTQVVTGFVVMNDKFNATYRAGFGRGETRGEVLLHELGHAVGLLHVADPAQMMYPAAIPRARAAYGKGDVAGLKRVGKPAGCIKPKPIGA